MDVNKFLGKRMRDSHLEELGICVRTARSRQEISEAASHLISNAQQLPPEERAAEIARVRAWASAQLRELTATEAENRDKANINRQPPSPSEP